MFKTLVDNSSSSLSMVETLKQCLMEPGLQEVDIATGYWDIPGLALIQAELDAFLQQPDTRFNLLIGKDPYVYANQLKEPKYKDATFPDDFIRTDIESLELKDEFQNAVKLLLKYCDNSENSKIQIRIFRKNEKDETQFLHSKCYIFKYKDHSYGLIGSSNFTAKGLQGNAELNHFDNDSSFVLAEPKEGAPAKGHRFWFYEKWELSECWNKVFLEQILKKAPIGEKAQKELEEESEPTWAYTPYELYIRYLQNQFGDIADSSQDTTLKSYLPKDYKSFTYQLDAVKQCFFIMKQYNGFILSDVVGLGKTVVGTLIIKKFIEEHASYEGRSANVLIVTPPAIKSGWLDTIRDFDEDAPTAITPYIDFITTGSIGNLLTGEDEEDNDDGAFTEALKDKEYGLIIIDESHNFRNHKTKKYQDLDNLISRIAQQHIAPFVGLLSATPQNNSPQDIYNQIKFFERNPNNTKLPTIEGGKLDSFFSNMEKEFQQCRKLEDRREAKIRLKYLSKQIREKVLDQLLVRRTRTDIKKYYSKYNEDLTFPELRGPKRIDYIMDLELADLFYNTIQAILPPNELNLLDNTRHLGYHRYQAIRYFKDEENKKFYEKNNLTVDMTTEQLASMMKKLLVKRLESSLPAFKNTLCALWDATKNMIKMLERNVVFICPDIDVNREFFDKNDEPLPFDSVCENIRSRIEKKQGNNREYRADDFREEYLEHLREDERILDGLCKRWNRVSVDPKLEQFKECLREEFFDRRKNTSQKLVIFTEAVDTMKELEKVVKAIHLPKNRRLRPLAISAANRDAMKEVIKQNFDANYKGEMKDDYDVIITTEVLAEGVNLHRSNTILNYDTPWNATKLMQRIGRVNRIASKEPFVYVYNFYPSATGNEQLMLIEIAFAKLQTFHTMFGEDSKIFSEDEEISEANFTQNFDGEESPYSKFISELKQFQENNAERFKELMEMPMENMGGQLRQDCTNGCFAVRSLQQGMLNLFADDKGNIKTVSPLEFADYLKTNSLNIFVKPESRELYETMKDSAIIEFSKHVTHSIHAKDINDKQKNALAAIAKIRLMLTDDAAFASLKAAERAVKDKNVDVIKAVLKWEEDYDRSGASMFGLNSDVNDWVKTAFKTVTEKAKLKKGEAYIALYEMN